MTVPQSVATILKEHVTLEVEGIDRMYLNVYVPKLQRELGVVAFFRYHRGAIFASSASFSMAASLSESPMICAGALSGRCTSAGWGSKVRASASAPRR